MLWIFEISPHEDVLWKHERERARGIVDFFIFVSRFPYRSRQALRMYGSGFDVEETSSKTICASVRVCGYWQQQLMLMCSQMKRWRAIEELETNNFFAFTHFFSFIHFIRLCIVYYIWSSDRKYTTFVNFLEGKKKLLREENYFPRSEFTLINFIIAQKT